MRNPFKLVIFFADIYFQFANFSVLALFLVKTWSSYRSYNFKFLTHFNLPSTRIAHFPNLLKASSSTSSLNLIYAIFFNTISEIYFDISL